MYFGLLGVPLGALGCPFVSLDSKREARSIEKTILGQRGSSYICMCFPVFSEVTDPSGSFGDVLWVMVSTFDCTLWTLVPLFLICEPNVS